MIAAYLAIAAGVWGPPPCGTPAVVKVQQPMFAAVTFAEECRIELDPEAWADMDAPRRCTLILHESGHLHYKLHSDKGIMRELIVEDDPRCSRKRIRAAAKRVD